MVGIIHVKRQCRLQEQRLCTCIMQPCNLLPRQLSWSVVFEYPGRHSHVNDPLLFVQSCSHTAILGSHSSTSDAQMGLVSMTCMFTLIAITNNTYASVGFVASKLIAFIAITIIRSIKIYTNLFTLIQLQSTFIDI